MKKLLLLLLILLIPVFLSACSHKDVATNTEAEAVATWLTQNGAKMYGAWWCPHCEEQKRLFGEAFKKINYIECANPDKSQNAVCQAAKIDSYPTWEFADGSRVNHVMDFEELKEKTGYPEEGITGPQPLPANP